MRWRAAKAVLLVGLLSSVVAGCEDEQEGRGQKGTVNRVDPPQSLDGVQLSSHAHGEITADTLKGAWTILFLGFTHCPDVCPLVLNDLAHFQSLRHQMGEVGKQVRVLFVSVDPARDSPRKLSEYAAYFDPSFMGATATSEGIQALESALGAYHRFGPRDGQGNYDVHHSAELYVLNDQAQLTARILPPVIPETLSRHLDALMTAPAMGGAL